MNSLYGLFLVLFLSEYAELPGNGGFYTQALRQGTFVTDRSKVIFIAGLTISTGKGTFPDSTAWFYHDNTNIIFTAAHNLVGMEYAFLFPETLEILEDIGQNEYIEIHPHQIELHPDYIHYDGDVTDNDIAKIKLETPIVLRQGHMPKVVEKDYKLTNFKSERLTIYGFGSDEFPYKLKQCDVKYMNATTHEDEFHCGLTGVNKLLFTWPVNGGDDYEHSLSGDSGAPVLNAAGEVVAMLTAGAEGLPDTIEPLAQHHDWIHREFRSNPNPKLPPSTGGHLSSSPGHLKTPEKTGKRPRKSHSPTSSPRKSIKLPKRK